MRSYFVCSNMKISRRFLTNEMAALKILRATICWVTRTYLWNTRKEFYFFYRFREKEKEEEEARETD